MGFGGIFHSQFFSYRNRQRRTEIVHDVDALQTINKVATYKHAAMQQMELGNGFIIGNTYM
jgi:hypothetical protein